MVKLDALQEIQQIRKVDKEVIKELKIKIIYEHIDNLSKEPPFDNF